VQALPKVIEVWSHRLEGKDYQDAGLKAFDEISMMIHDACGVVGAPYIREVIAGWYEYHVQVERHCPCKRGTCERAGQ